jgi:hypothetical protein
MIRRSDLASARTALEAAGFIYTQLLDLNMFIDGPQVRPSRGLHILFAGERVKPEYENSSPDVSESERAANFQVATLNNRSA